MLLRYFNEKSENFFRRVLETYECNNLEIPRALQSIILGEREAEIKTNSTEELKVKIKSVDYCFNDILVK